MLICGETLEQHNTHGRCDDMRKFDLSWDDVFKRLEQFDKPGEKIYGIPRGGMIAAGFLKNAEIVHMPHDATSFLDDIVDSGRTRAKYVEKFPGIPFNTLVDKFSEKEKKWYVFPWEDAEQDGRDIVARQLEFIGEDPTREGLLETPDRVVRSWSELYAGYDQDYREILSKDFAAADYDEMVVVKDIEFHSTCEHHMLPFVGSAHIAYLPKKRVVGLSKMARLVECFARRLQIQELLTTQIASAIDEVLEPNGVAVCIEAKHFCMVCRGVKKQNSSMITSCLKGSFRKNHEVRAEFFSLLRR